VAEPKTELAKANLDVGSLTEAFATEIARNNPEMAGQLIMALVKMNTTALPETVFVRREGVTIRRTRSRVRLSIADGTLNPAGDGKFSISMDGFRKLNEVPALSVIRPEYVVVDGDKRGNPYIIVDPRTDLPKVVHARAVVVGYSPTGSLAATDVMVRLDMNIYIMENIQAKLKKADTPQQADAIAIYGSDDEPPTDEQGQKRAGYKFMPIHAFPGGAFGLWVNKHSRAMQAVFQDHTTRLKFVERLAQSFAERNALKAHPSIPRVLHVDRGVAMVEVFGWTTDFNRSEIDNLRKLVENDLLHEFRDGKGRSVSVDVRQETTIDAEDLVALDEVTQSEAAAEAAKDDEAEAGADEPDAELLPNAIKGFGRLTQLKGVKKARTVLKGLEIDTLEVASTEELVKFLEELKKIEGA